jgi:hypothetical protein
MEAACPSETSEGTSILHGVVTMQVIIYNFMFYICSQGTAAVIWNFVIYLLTSCDYCRLGHLFALVSFSCSLCYSFYWQFLCPYLLLLNFNVSRVYKLMGEIFFVSCDFRLFLIICLNRNVFSFFIPDDRNRSIA